MLSFKSTFSLSSFTFKRLFSALLSAIIIRVVSPAYLRLLIFHPAMLIPACASSSPAFLMMYSPAAAAAAAKTLQSCPILCDPIDGNPPGSPVPGILQAITLEWVAISFSTFTVRKSEKWKWSHSVVSNSAYKLNKQGDNVQPWWTPFPIWNQSVVPCPVLTVSWPASRFLKRQVRWSGFPSVSEFSTVYCDPHSQRLWHSQ